MIYCLQLDFFSKIVQPYSTDWIHLNMFLSCLDAGGSLSKMAATFPFLTFPFWWVRGNQVQCKRPPGLILTCCSTWGFISAAPILVNNLLQSGLFLHETPTAIHNEDQITRRQSLSLKHWKCLTGAQGTWKRA